MEFFELYGKDFNYLTTGISVRQDGSYFSKSSRGWQYQHRPMLLAVENPSDTNMDVGKNSFNIMRVKRAFEHAYHALRVATAHREWRETSLLASIVNGQESALLERTLPPTAVFTNLQSPSRPPAKKRQRTA